MKENKKIKGDPKATYFNGPDPLSFDRGGASPFDGGGENHGSNSHNFSFFEFTLP